MHYVEVNATSWELLILVIVYIFWMEVFVAKKEVKSLVSSDILNLDFLLQSYFSY